MRNTIFALLILALSMSCAGRTGPSTSPTDSKTTSSAPPQTPNVTPASLPGPQGAVITGDYPDPSMIRVGSDYWAVSTSSAWAPVFPLLHSKDLANWEQESAVFKSPPTWADGNYWAPEIAHLGNGANAKFYVFYSAKNQQTGKMCIAIADSAKVRGPYKDHGTLACGAIGSIDASAVTDDNGRVFVTWKEDGNSINQPTPIYIQQLDLKTYKLIGTRATAITNDAPWESGLVEGPFILKHDRDYYLFYSGNGCCNRDCNYALGVARAKSLNGPWEKNPGNPILRGNDLWKCPGHGSIAQDLKGRDFLMYHAYNRRDFVYVGRQAMVDQVDWGADGWPTINGGQGPSSHVDGVLGHVLRNAERTFEDDFKSPTLRLEWQWPAAHAADVSIIKDGSGHELQLKASGDQSQSVVATESVLAHPTTDGDYGAEVTLDLRTMSSTSKAALALYGNDRNAIGLSYQNDTLEIWSRLNGKVSDVESFTASRVLQMSLKDRLYMQMKVTGGHLIHFAVSDDGRSWQPVGTLVRDGFRLPPWDLGVRVALITQIGEARFQSFRLSPML